MRYFLNSSARTILWDNKSKMFSLITLPGALIYAPCYESARMLSDFIRFISRKILPKVIMNWVPLLCRFTIFNTIGISCFAAIIFPESVKGFLHDITNANFLSDDVKYNINAVLEKPVLLMQYYAERLGLLTTCSILVLVLNVTVELGNDYKKEAVLAVLGTTAICAAFGGNFVKTFRETVADVFTKSLTFEGAAKLALSGIVIGTLFNTIFSESNKEPETPSLN